MKTLAKRKTDFIGNCKPMLQNDFINAYKKLRYLQENGLNYFGKHITRNDIIDWNILIEHDVEAFQMDNLAELAIDEQKSEKFSENDILRRKNKIIHYHDLKINLRSSYEKMKFLSIFGFIDRKDDIKKNDILNWDNLTQIDSDAAQLDQYAENILADLH